MYRSSNSKPAVRQSNRIVRVLFAGLLIFLMGRWVFSVFSQWHPLTSLQDMFIRDPKAHLAAGIKNLQAAQEEDPPDPAKLDAAIERLSKALALDEQNAEGYMHRSVAYWLKRMLTEGLRDANRAVQLRANYPEAYLSRAYIRFDMGAQEEAITDLDKVIELQPNNEEALSTRGAYYFRKEMYPKALEDFEALIKLSPENPRYWFVRGNIYSSLGNIELMVESLNRTLDIAPIYGLKLSKYEFERWQRSFDRNSASYKQLEELIARL